MADMEEVQEALRRAQEETNATRQKLKNAVKKGKGIDEERQALAAKVQELELQREQNTRQGEDATASAEVEALRATVAEYKEKLRNAVKKGKAIDSDRQQLQQEVESLRESLQAKDAATSPAEIDTLQAQVAEYKEKLKNAVKKGKGIEAERQKLAEQVASLQDTRAQAGPATEGLRRSLAEQTHQLEAAVEGGELLKADLALKLAEIEELKVSLQAEQESHASSQEQAAVHREALVAAGARVSEAQRKSEQAAELLKEAGTERDEAVALAESLRSELERSQQEAAEAQAGTHQIDSKCQQMEEVLQAREQQLGTIQEELATLRAKAHEAADTVSAAAASAAEARQRAEELRLARQEIEQLQETLRERDEADSELQSLHGAEKTRFEEEAKAALGQAALLCQELDEAKAKLQAAKEAKSQSQAVPEELQAMLQEQVAQVESQLKASTAALETEVSVLEDKLAAAQTDLAAVKQERDQAHAKLEAAEEEKAKSGPAVSEEAHVMLQEQMAQVEAELKARSAAWQSELSNLGEKLDVAQADLTAVRQERDALKEKLSAADRYADKATADDGQKESKLDSANEQIAMLQSAMAAAAMRIREASTARDEAESKLEERTDEAAALRRKLAEVEGKLEVLDHLEEQAARLHDDLKAARTATEMSEQSLQAVTEAKSLAQAQVARLEEQLAKAEASAGSSVAFSEEHAAELHAKAEEVEEKVALAAEKERKAVEALRLAKVREDELAVREAAAEQRVAAAQAEARRVAAEAEERSRRFAHVQSMFAKKEAAFGDRQSAARAEADLARSQAAEASAAAATALSEADAATGRARDLEAAVGNLEKEKAKLLAQVAEADGRLMDLEVEASKVEVVQVQASEAQRRADRLAAEAERLESERTEMAMRAEAAEASAKDAERQIARLRKEADSKAKETERLRTSRDQAIRGLLERDDVSGDQPDVREAAGGAEEGTLESELEHLREENLSLQSQVGGVEKRIASEKAQQAARIAALEKTNQQLTWQIAMTANSGAIEEGRGAAKGLAVRAGSNVSPRGDGALGAKGAPKGLSLASVLGWILAHRKILIAAYLTILHLIVYFALTHGAFSFSSYAKLQCDSATPSELALTAPASLQMAQQPFTIPPPPPPGTDAAQAVGHAVVGSVDHRHLGELPLLPRERPADPQPDTEEQILHQTLSQRLHHDAIDPGQGAGGQEAVESLPLEARAETREHLPDSAGNGM